MKKSELIKNIVERDKTIEEKRLWRCKIKTLERILSILQRGNKVVFKSKRPKRYRITIDDKKMFYDALKSKNIDFKDFARMIERTQTYISQKFSLKNNNEYISEYLHTKCKELLNLEIGCVK